MKHDITTVRGLRARGFQFRRISFSLKVITGIWAVAMIALSIGGSWMHFFSGITGLIAFCLPALLVATAFDAMAEKQFMRAAAQAEAEQPILGVVRPRVYKK